MDHSAYRVCSHDPCTLQSSFINLQKELGIVAATRDYIFRPYSNLYTFQWQSKLVAQVGPFFPYYSIVLVQQELLTILEHLCSPPIVNGVLACYSMFIFICMYCLSFCTFFFAIWCCLFFDIWIVIAPVVCSNSSYILW